MSLFKSTVLLLAVCKCISGQYLLVLGANILAGQNGGIPGVLDAIKDTVKDDFKHLVSGRSIFNPVSQLVSVGKDLASDARLLADSGKQTFEQGLGQVFDKVDQVKLAVGSVAGQVNDKVTAARNAYHSGAKDLILVTQLDLALKQLHYFYVRRLPVPQSIFDRIVSLATQLDDGTRESVTTKVSHVETLTAKLNDNLSAGSADPTADVDAVIEATDDINKDIVFALTAGSDKLGQLKQQLTDLAANGSQPAIKVAQDLKKAADRTANSLLPQVIMIKQQLVDNEQLIRQQLDSATGDRKTQLQGADYKLTKQIDAYEKLAQGISSVLDAPKPNATK